MDEGMAAFGGESIAGFQTSGARKSGARSSGGRHAGLETRDTADLEVCDTTTGQSVTFFTGAVSGCTRIDRARPWRASENSLACKNPGSRGSSFRKLGSFLGGLFFINICKWFM
jgi:hypothetical protein